MSECEVIVLDRRRMRSRGTKTAEEWEELAASPTILGQRKIEVDGDWLPPAA